LHKAAAQAALSAVDPTGRSRVCGKPTECFAPLFL
jgi:hypothetical protein